MLRIIDLECTIVIGQVSSPRRDGSSHPKPLRPRCREIGDGELARRSLVGKAYTGRGGALICNRLRSGVQAQVDLRIFAGGLGIDVRFNRFSRRIPVVVDVLGRKHRG